MGKLLCDYNFTVSKNIIGGISEQELEKYKAKIETGFERLQKMVEEGSVGFPKLPEYNTAPIKEFAKDIKNNFNDLIVVGIGGSALGIEAVVNAILPYGYNAMSYTDRGCMPRIWVADNVDPSKIQSILKICTPDDTVAVVISKSGNTVETAENFSLIHDWFKSKIQDLRKHIVVVTDPDKGPLREYAEKNGLQSFPIHSSIGGRFSVMSPVGLVPAAILGIDIDKILEGAASITSEGMAQIKTLAAIYLYFMEKGKNINVLMPYSSRLDKFAEWFCQLWGESLGKKYTFEGKEITFGSTPVRAVGAIDQHSQIQLYREGPLDKVVTFIHVENHDNDSAVKGDFYESFGYLKGLYLGKLLNSELKATEAALLTSRVPSLKISINMIDEYSLGQLFMLFQYIVPVIGLAVNINPFDQPGVEEAKEYAYGLMNRAGFENKKAQFEGIYKKDDAFII